MERLRQIVRLLFFSPSEIEFEQNPFFLNAGIAIGLIPTSLFVLQSLFWLFGGTASAFPVALALGVSSTIFLLLTPRGRRRTDAAWGGALLFLVFALGYEFLQKFSDFSFDGLWYHLDAIRIYALEGFNPFHDLQPKTMEDVVACYPKAAWTAAVPWVKLTGDLESGRLNGLLLLISNAFLLFGALPGNRLLRLALAFLLAFNPVSFLQLGCHYVDGLLSSSLLFMLVLLWIGIRQKERKWGYLLLAQSLFFLNLKFTSVLFFLSLAAFLVLYRYASWKKDVKRWALPSGLFFVIAVGLLGYPTYVHNVLKHQHPFFPVAGPGNRGNEYRYGSYPADFFGTQPWERFYLSSLSAPVEAFHPYISTRKAWFSLPREQFGYGGYVSNLGGFGPLYLEISLIALLALLTFRPRFSLVYVGIAWLLSILIWFPESWVARYVPMLWFLPALSVVGLVYTSSKKSQFVGYLLLFALLWNLRFMYRKHWEYQKYLNATEREWVAELKKEGMLRFYPGWMKSLSFRLQHKGVHFEAVYDHYYPDSLREYWPNLGFSNAFIMRSPAFMQEKRAKEEARRAKD